MATGRQTLNKFLCLIFFDFCKIRYDNLPNKPLKSEIIITHRDQCIFLSKNIINYISATYIHFLTFLTSKKKVMRFNKKLLWFYFYVCFIVRNPRLYNQSLGPTRTWSVIFIFIFTITNSGQIYVSLL